MPFIHRPLPKVSLLATALLVIACGCSRDPAPTAIDPATAATPEPAPMTSDTTRTTPAPADAQM